MIDSPLQANTPHVVYIRKDIINNQPVWSLREEDGELLAYAKDKESLENALDENYRLEVAH